MSEQKWEMISHPIKENGAADRTNLEPAPVDDILSELEEWGRFIDGEPGLIHILDSFHEVTSSEENNDDLIPQRSPVHRGPSL